MNKEALQDNLIELRQKKGLTQKQLADTINYSDKVISKWERGESYPNIEALSVLSNYYDISIDYLVGKDTPVEKTGNKTIELDVIKTESPTFLAYLFIVPFAVYFLWTLILWPSQIGIGGIFLGLGMIIYSGVLSKSTFESTYNGTSIKLRNRAFSCKLFIGDTLVSEIKQVLKVNPVLEGELNKHKVKVVMLNTLSIKCRMYIN